MPIQLIIFLTKNKIFASEINNNGQADAISINGNSEIKCEGKESIDELIECLYDAYNIDDFADDNFDIVIIDCNADREVIKNLETNCGSVKKFNIISIEKILPVIASAKNLIKVGEKVTLAFSNQFYNVSCDEKGFLTIIIGDKDKKPVLIETKDFTIVFSFKLIVNNNPNELKMIKYETETLKYKQTILELNRKLSDLQKELQDAKKALGSKTQKSIVKDVQDKSASDLTKVLQKHKMIFESAPEYEGEFYISGEIPSSKFPRNAITHNQVSESSAYSYLLRFSNEEALAVYSFSNCREDNALRYLLITKDGILYSTDMSGVTGFVYWDRIKSIDCNRVFNDCYIFLNLTNGRSIKFYRIDKAFRNKKTSQKFLLNLLMDVKNLKLT